MQTSRKNGNNIKKYIHTSSVLYNEEFNPSMASYLESVYRLWKSDR